MSLPTRRKVIRIMTLILVILAFGNSYQHGVTWAQAHSPAAQPEFWAWLIAALPELLVILAVLSFPENRWGIRTLIPGSLAVAWTLWANGSAAAPGLSGLFIAVSPALVSLLALAKAHENQVPEPMAEPEPAQQKAQAPRVRKAQPEPSAPGSGLILLGSRPSAAEPVSRETVAQALGLRDRGIQWAQAQDPVPTAGEIMRAHGGSLATAKRIRAAALAAQQQGARDEAMTP